MSLLKTNIHQQTKEHQLVSITPDRYHAIIFDMDGVITQTAQAHAAAWREVFDEFLRKYSKEYHIQFKPFDIQSDYRRYVDGKSRHDGIRSFLKSRDIVLPEGSPEDPPEADTIYALGNRKNNLFLAYLRSRRVETYASSIEFIHRVKKRGIPVAVISASKNAVEVLQSAGVQHLFDVKVDGMDAERLHLKGKPAPDVFLEAARQLGTDPEHTVVVEDALAGVQAGQSGNFALVIGINRNNQADLLKGSGADIVLNDLDELNVEEKAKALPIRPINPWLLIYEGYDPAQEGIRETLCTLGNGYFATRGALFNAQDDGIHYPGTYVAGGYNRLKSKILDREIETEDLVNLPNWLMINFRIDQGDWFNINQCGIHSYTQMLDLRQGVLHRKIRFEDRQGRETLLSERRLVHMQHFHLAALELTITPVNWQGNLEIECALDGRVVNNNVKNFQGLSNKHLRAVESDVPDEDTLFLKMQTVQSDLGIAQTARVRIRQNGKEPGVSKEVIHDVGYIARHYRLPVSKNDEIVLEKVLALYTSQDNAISECGYESRKSVKDAPDFESLLESHEKAWHHLWERFDIQLELVDPKENELSSLLVRLNVFHLLQTVSPNSIDLDTNIPARGLHGEAYQGHIFWDNLFVFPFINYHLSDITESLLKYRYRRLNEAKRLARLAGLKGALYPWQSGSNGEEETPPLVFNDRIRQWLPDYTHLQRHVNAAIVYNIWEYYQITGDLDFLFSYGAEIVLEIARLWGSLASYNATLDRYEIKGVVGPDEYHQHYPGRKQAGIDNNAYTNIMAVWCLCRALEILEIMPDDSKKAIIARLDLKEDERCLWEKISRKMRVDFFGNGIISQFEGYENLEEFSLEKYRKQHGDFRHFDSVMMAEGRSLDQYKIGKQADVLMLFYLFSAETLRELFDRLHYTLSPETIPLNIDYYSRRTVHGSSLSRIANAWVLVRSNRNRSWNLFSQELIVDFSDTQGGTTPEGIHLGAIGGTLDLLQRCYAGLELRNDTLWFNPVLPTELKKLCFSVHYRDNLLRIAINQKSLRIEVNQCRAKAIQVGYRDQIQTLQVGQNYEFQIENQPY